MPVRTIYRMFQETVERCGGRPAIGFRSDKSAPIQYQTYNEVDQKVRALRKGLDALGLRSGDRVGILSENRAEWVLIDLASQSLGLIIVAPYSSLPAGQAGFIVRDSGCKILVYSDSKQLKKITEFRESCTDLQHVYSMEGDAATLADSNVKPFDEIVAAGASNGRTDVELDAISKSIDPDQTALFIYTSGTTGDPKGAMLSHKNILHTPDAVVDEPIAELSDQDQFLSFLPLSHITERVGGYYLPLRVGACIIFSLGLSSIGQEITETVRPTVMLCVPRIFENMHSKFIDSLEKMDEKMRKKVQWGLQTGILAAQARSAGKSPGFMVAIKYLIAEKLILPKIREKVTGGRIRFFVSGGAPLDLETATFFLGIGIQILEGYGLSETNIISINRPGRQRIGYVGQLLPHVEIDLAADGEINMRGDGRMKGYFNRSQDTAEAIDADGWFHTGDVGEMTKDGYLKITDRKKDLIVLTNGKKVAPQPIEAMLKQSPYIGEAVLLGDRQSTIMALLVPNFMKLIEWAKEKGLECGDVAKLIEGPEVQKLLKSEVDRMTVTLADYEKIKRFRTLTKPFSIETGELTPTLKVKRKFVAEKFAEVIASMARA